tara:strand:- start:716 stop:1276 length:561 start_codon:yes stop_codon:yes gene_type:complete
MEIIDNFFEEEYFNHIQSKILHADHPWYYMDNISIGKEITTRETDLRYGFNYSLIKSDDKGYDLGEMNKFIYDVSIAANANVALRSRMDMTTNRGESYKLEPHVDFEYPHITTIFYVNDSDGNTIIYNQKYNDRDKYDQKLTVKEEIEPVANRLLIFDGLFIHTGHTPSKHNRRILINSNFKYREP